VKKLNKKIPLLIILLLIFLPVFLIIPQLQNNLVSADIDEVIEDNNFSDIDTLVLEDDFEERYYNNIYSQYENASMELTPSSYTLRPNAVGTHNQLQTAGETTAWECLDEVISDEDATWVGSTSLIVEQTATVDITDIGEVGTIKNVTIYFNAKKTINDGYYYLTIRTTDGSLFNTSIPINFAWTTYEVVYLTNPQTSLDWTSDDIDNLELGGSTMKYDTYSARFSQVYCIVHVEPEVELSSTTTHKKQERSYYRAYGGLYSYLHNVSRNYTQYDIVIKHNSSIIINFVSLSIFPKGLTFFLYFNCFYNISLFIGTEEYVLRTHDYSIDDWKWVSIRLNRREYLITDTNADFYIKIYPIENNNTHDLFHMDNLKVKYTDPEPVIDFDTYCQGGEEYEDYAIINATSSSFYASSSGVNDPDGWLDGDSKGWFYNTSSNGVFTRGIKIGNLWTLRDYTLEIDNFWHYTEINFTIDKDYYIYDEVHFHTTISNGYQIRLSHRSKVYADDILIYEHYEYEWQDESFYDDYFELTYILNFVQLNDKSMQLHWSFKNALGNSTDYRPLIFEINNGDVESGLMVAQYKSSTLHKTEGAYDTNPIIYQKVSRDIHNSPIDSLTDIIDTYSGIGSFFRQIWDKILASFQDPEIPRMYNIWLATLESQAYYQALIDQMGEMIENIDNPDWVDTFFDDIQEIQDTYAEGLVGSWRDMFGNDDISGLENNFMSRWGSRIADRTRGGDGIFSKLFGSIFGEDVSLIPKLIWQFFLNLKAWAVIGFVMFIIMFMKMLMKRDYAGVKGVISMSISVILFIVRLVQWLISFIIRILTMIGGFIPFT